MTGYIILGILVAFILITLIRAAFYKPKKQSFSALPEEEVDAERAAANLSRAIQFRTFANPEESQTDFAPFQEFHAFLEEAYPLTYTKLKKEDVSSASLLYHWKGTDPALEPIALLAHQDVVPVGAGTEADWTFPAFSGHNDGEFIWGRGSLDMKNHLICVMEAVETLLQEGYEPQRDIYLCFGHNEEVLGAEVSGARDIVTLLQSRGVRLDSLLDEGGMFLSVKLKNIFDKKVVAVAISEKGYADYEISINAKGGHSSMPPKHNALGELAVAIQELEDNQFPSKMLPFLTELLSNVGRNTNYLGRLLFCNLWLIKPLVKLVMKQIPMGASLIRTTTTVTMAQGSPACNVLPQKAVANVNLRTMPGVSLAEVEQHIRKVTSNKNLEIRLAKGREAAPFSPTDSRAYKMIETLALSQEADGVMVPFLVMGGTDAINYVPICDNIYRFSPFCITMDLMNAVHSTNERLPVSSVPTAVAFFKRYIRGLTGEG